MVLLTVSGKDGDASEAEDFKQELKSTSHFSFDFNLNIDEDGKISNDQMEMIFSQTRRFKTSLSASVLVFDLDDTIIDEDGTVFSDDLYPAINRLRSLFDFIGIWSHGTTNHVFKYVEKIHEKYNVSFDFVITREDEVKNKPMGRVLEILNRKFGIGKIKLSCLVDDKKSSYEDDYSVFIHLTRKPKSFLEISDTIERYSRQQLRIEMNME